MLLSQIKNYNHKIKEIIITNNNQTSIYNQLVTRFSLDIPSNTTVRFSLNKNNDYIEHQKIDGDYFVRIPNKIKDTLIIYAHLFPSDLYTYEEGNIVYNNIDFTNIKSIVNKYGYTENIDKDTNKLKIESLLYQNENDENPSIRNPNYKQYITPNSSKEKWNMSEKGKFPLTSRFRNNDKENVLNITPNMPDSESWAFPSWKTNSKFTSNPYYKLTINRNNLSGLISNDSPINIYMGYKYTPSSSEYHQHYMGFTDTNPSNEDILMFDGENLNTIDNRLGSQAYRVIKRGNFYNTQFSTSHTKGVPIILTFGSDSNTHNCIFNKNTCKNYFQLKTIDNGESYASNTISGLDNTASYTLKYFVYIPRSIKLLSDVDLSSTDINNQEINIQDCCYIDIDGNQINNEFHQRDYHTLLRSQWIYHEINFTPKNNTAIIKLYGSGIKDGKIYYSNITLQKDDYYNPLLKYNNRQYIIQENNHVTPPRNLNTFADDVSSYTNVNNSTIYQPTNQIDLNVPVDSYVLSLAKHTYIRAPNNKVIVYCRNSYDDYLINGTVTLTLITDATTNESISYTQEITEPGFTVFNCNFYRLDSSKSPYQVKLKYENDCDSFDDSDQDIDSINISSTSVNLSYTDTTLTLSNWNSNHAITVSVKAQTTTNGVTTDDNNYIVDYGYIELYKNDISIQSTLVKEGKATFYLSDTDKIVGNYVLKFVYKEGVYFDDTIIYGNLIINS